MNFLKRVKIATAALGIAVAGSAASAAVIDLGFAIDESGSVSGTPTSGELGLIRQGLASALDQIPSVGAANNPNTYSVTIVRFTRTAGILVDRTVITDTSRAEIQNTLLTTERVTGGTTIPSSINLLTETLCGGAAGCTADTTIFNVATDGQGGDSTNAAAAAAAAGVDSLNYEAIGSGASTRNLLATAFPGTPVLVSDIADIPDPLVNSFVLEVGTFEDFAAAIGAKVGVIVDSTGGNSGGGNNNGGGMTPPAAVPLPAGMPMLLLGLGVLGGASLRKRAKAA